jgi:hypothetical protein
MGFCFVRGPQNPRFYEIYSKLIKMCIWNDPGIVVVRIRRMNIRWYETLGCLEARRTWHI